MTNQNGRFGIHGGQYIPETLMNAVIELEEAYNHYKNDTEFKRELNELFNEYAGNQSGLSHLLCKKSLTEYIVYFMRARMVEVFTLEVNFGAA